MLHELAHLLGVEEGKLFEQKDGDIGIRCATCGKLRIYKTRWKSKLAWVLMVLAIGVLLGLTVGAMSGCAASDHIPEPTKMVQLKGEQPLTGSHCFEGPEVIEP